MATFKDDGYSAYKEITRDGFGELIGAIQAGLVDVVIVRGRWRSCGSGSNSPGAFSNRAACLGALEEP